MQFGNNTISRRHPLWLIVSDTMKMSMSKLGDKIEFFLQTRCIILQSNRHFQIIITIIVKLQYLWNEAENEESIYMKQNCNLISIIYVMLLFQFKIHVFLEYWQFRIPYDKWYCQNDASVFILTESWQIFLKSNPIIELDEEKRKLPRTANSFNEAFHNHR